MSEGNDVTRQKLYYNYDKFKSTCSQIIAVLIGNVIMLQFGMSIAISTVVNGELMMTSQKSSQGLMMNSSEASWYGSFLLITHPIGSILSSFIQDKFGRKWCLALVAVPEFFGWLCLYAADSIYLLYVSSICLGIAMGLSEAPILIYIGECVEPRIRSRLSSFTVLCSMIGLFITFTVASIFSWRQIAFVYMFLPIFVFVMTISIIPESPVWLLSKKKTAEAVKALSWLRGFTNKQVVHDELNYMTEFATRRFQNENQFPTKRYCCGIHFMNNLCHILMDKTVLKSFIMFNVLFILCTVSGMLPAKPYWRNIMDKIGLEGLPFNSRTALVYSGAGTLVGAFLNTFTVRYITKRKLLIVSILISTSCQFALGLYALGYLKWFTNNAWLPFCLFCCISFISGYGITPIPWILLGEIFPMKSRGILSGVTAALNSIMAFILTKTYWDVVDLCSLPYTIILHALFGIIGIPYIQYNLPDTENKTLQQIQNDMESNVTNKNIN